MRKRATRGWDCLAEDNPKKNKTQVNADGMLDNADITAIIADAVGASGIAKLDDPIHVVLQAGMNEALTAPLMIDEAHETVHDAVIPVDIPSCLDCGDDEKHVMFPSISSMEHELRLMIPSTNNAITCASTGKTVKLPACTNGRMCVCEWVQIEDEEGSPVAQSLVGYVTEVELKELFDSGELPPKPRPCVCCIRHDSELMNFKEFVEDRRVGQRQFLYTNVCQPQKGGFPAYMFVTTETSRSEATVVRHRCRQLMWIRDPNTQQLAYLKFIGPYFRIERLFPCHVVTHTMRDGMVSMVQARDIPQDDELYDLQMDIPAAFAIECAGGILVDRSRVHAFRKVSQSHFFASLFHRITKQNSQSKLPQFDTMRKYPPQWSWIVSITRLVTSGMLDNTFTPHRRTRLLDCTTNYSIEYCDCNSGDTIQHLIKHDDVWLLSWVYLCCVKYIVWFASVNAPALRAYINEFMQFELLIQYIDRYSWPLSFERNRSQLIQAAHDCMSFINRKAGWTGIPKRLSEIVASYPSESPRAFSTATNRWLNAQPSDDIPPLSGFIDVEGDDGFIPDDWLSDVMPTEFAESHRPQPTLSLSVVQYIWRTSYHCHDIVDVEAHILDWSFMKRVGCSSRAFNIIRLAMTNNDVFSSAGLVDVRNCIERLFPYEFSIIRTLLTGWNRNSYVRMGYLNPLAYIAQCIAIRNCKESQRFGNDTKICSVLVCELCWRVACRVKGRESHTSQKSKKRKPAIRLFSPEDEPLVMLCEACEDEKVRWVDLRGSYLVIKSDRIIFCGGCCQICVWSPMSPDCMVFPVDLDNGMPLCAECKETWFEQDLDE